MPGRVYGTEFGVAIITASVLGDTIRGYQSASFRISAKETGYLAEIRIVTGTASCYPRP